MDVEEPEDLRLGVADRVEDRPFFQRATLGQIDHHLHAHGPLVALVADGHAVDLVQTPAHGTDRTVADNRKIGADLAAVGGQHDARDFAVLEQRIGYRRSGPDLRQAGEHHLLPAPLHELPEGEDEAVLLVKKCRDVGRFVGQILARQAPDDFVSQAHPPRAPGSAVRVQ